MHKEIVFNNKLRLITAQLPNTYSTNIGVFVKAGTINEIDNNYGCAHFLEHMLFKGTKNRSSKDIAEEIDGVGGIINAYTSHEYTCYFTRSLPEDGELSLEILYDMMANSLLDKGEIEKEKKVILEEINMYEDEPHSFIIEEFTKGMYKGSPLGYSILGEKKLVKKVTRELLIQYFRQNYRPENMIIVITGAFEENLIEQVKTSFGNLTSMGLEALPEEPSNQSVHFDMKVFERDNVNQIYFVMGMPGFGKTHSNFYKLLILNTILGGSPSSHLFQEVREKLSLCYDIGSYASGFRDAGELIISGGSNQENFPTALKEIHRILSELKSNGISKEEFERGRKQIKSHLVMSAESAKNIMFKVASAYIYHDVYKGTAHTVAILDKIQYEEFNQFVKDYLPLKELSVCLLGPKGTNRMKKVWKEINEQTSR